MCVSLAPLHQGFQVVKIAARYSTNLVRTCQTFKDSLDHSTGKWWDFCILEKTAIPGFRSLLASVRWLLWFNPVSQKYPKNIPEEISDIVGLSKHNPIPVHTKQPLNETMLFFVEKISRYSIGINERWTVSWLDSGGPCKKNKLS